MDNCESQTKINFESSNLSAMRANLEKQTWWFRQQPWMKNVYTCVSFEIILFALFVLYPTYIWAHPITLPVPLSVSIYKVRVIISVDHNCALSWCYEHYKGYYLCRPWSGQGELE
jgi:hypothetical protein